MNRAIVTYAADAHEELLDVSLPTFKDFAHRHDYDVLVGQKMTDLPPAWNKIPLLLEALKHFDEVVWLDCDVVIVDPTDDFPAFKDETVLHSMVRHFEDHSEVPNSGVWRLRKGAEAILRAVSLLDVFTNHGWWEQAALMTVMGYTVPPEGSHFPDTRCKCVQKTVWYKSCQFMRLYWNSHPQYRADKPRIVHCSYQDMPRRLEVMRSLVKDPNYNYPKFDEESEVAD
jgi:hypothetical protein